MDAIAAGIEAARSREADMLARELLGAEARRRADLRALIRQEARRCPLAPPPFGPFGDDPEAWVACEEQRLLERELRGVAEAADPCSLRPFGGKTALMLAAAARDALAVEALLPRSDPRARSSDGATALMLAAEAGCPRCVAALCPSGDLLAVDLVGRTALHLSAYQGSAAGTAALLDALGGHVAEIEPWGPLREAASGANASAMGELLGAFDPKAADPRDGLTPLMVAILAGSVECVELLLPRADLAATCAQGRTAERIARDESRQWNAVLSEKIVRLIQGQQARNEREDILAGIVAEPIQRRAQCRAL